MKTSIVSALALLALALLGRAAPPDEADRLLDRARTFDAQAEKLLDEGKRPAAFEALARAADLRERVRRLRAGETLAPEAPEPPLATDPKGAAKDALAGMQAALARDDLKAAAAEGRRAFEALDRWTARLEAAPDPGLARRLEGLEAQVRQMKDLLDGRDR